MSSAPNVGVTSGGSVTISGLSFGGLGFTPTASIGAADVCGSTAWTSATTVACAPQTYSGSILRTAVSVSAVAATLTGQLSFDGMLTRAFGFGLACIGVCCVRPLSLDCSAPVVSISSMDRANVAVSARTHVTISGLNFGSSNCSPTASLTISDQCSSTAWTSVTAVLCAPQSYSSGVQRTSVIARGASSTWTTPFSFDGIQLTPAP
jgi:hypothetical protein